jgi:NAD(P)-dependent dehydrogenase (short-subunit alcohol dehydrogenase family)
MRTYANEMADTAVRTNCFSPGATRTKMRATAMPGEDPMTLPTPEEVAKQVMEMCLPDFTDNGGVWKYEAKGLFKQF